MAGRILRLLEHRGLGRQSGPDEAYPLPCDQPLFAELDGASVHGRVTGPFFANEPTVWRIIGVSSRRIDGPLIRRTV